MFTGIIQGTARVSAVHGGQGLKRLVVSFPPGRMSDIHIGASVSIDGTCLTVVEQEGDDLHFDVMQETLARTKAGLAQAGTVVNFERAARIGDEIGGHLLSGHVHTQAFTRQIDRQGDNVTLTFEVPAEWMKYIFPKGFIAIDGASLTVGTVTADSFSVYLIPETLRVTHFDTLGPGDVVNIEVDSQTQTIVDTLERLGYQPPQG